MTRNRKKPFPFFLWHRRLGLLAMVLMIILAITGILLNHTESLKLDETAVESDILLNWYELNPEGLAIQFSFGEDTVSQWDKQIFFNFQPVISSDQLLTGFIAIEDMYIVSLQNMILLVDNNGELIEQIDTQHEFNSIKAIGRRNGQLIVATDTDEIYMADTNIVSWQKTKLKNTQWSSKNPVSEQQQHKLKQAFRGQGLMLERVILDLHSGRIFNSSWGIYLMDASAIIMILLSISGTWVWYSRKQKQKSKRHYQKHHK